MVNKEMAGKKLVDFELPVERGKIEEFAKSICDPNPVYVDRVHAKKQGFNDVLAPPTFIMSFPHHLPSENFVLEFFIKLGLDVGKSVHGETEFIYERPVCAGENLRGECRVGEIFEKEGKRGGKMTMVELVIALFDETGQQVMTGKNLFIEKS